MGKDAFRVRNGSLEQISDGEVSCLISLESNEWFEWLENHHRFYFESVHGKFTARKEQRSGNWYWYAYRRVRGTLSTAYLGRSQNLTFGRLQTVAQAFCAQSFPGPFQRSGRLPLSSLEEFATQETLLLTKLQIPLLHPGLVARPTLVERLNVDTQNKLVLLSAPAGSGKTTLLSEWAAGCCWPLSWVSLDRLDNDPVRFWRYLIAALEYIQPGVGNHALALLRSPQTVPIEAVITALVNALTALPHDFALVLDDYHFIETQAIHQALLFFLKHLPTNMHVIIASRVEPPLSLPSLRVHWRVAEWRSSDLRFTPAEVAAFFLKTANLDLSPEIITSLETFTEGWIAGLQLAALSVQRAPDIPGFFQAFTGHDTYIFDYLANEVWQRQPASSQQFLLKAALPERVNASLCNALTGQTNSQQMLEQFERANLFLVCLDNQRCWYRFHHLFRTFLLDQLRTLQPEKVNELHVSACRWHMQHGLMIEAIDHALLAGDMLLAARLVMNVGQTMVRTHEMVTLLQWLNALPEKLVSSLPRLCLLRAWTQIAAGQFLSSECWVQRAGQLAENARSPLPGEPEQFPALEGEIAVLRSHLAVFHGDIARALVDTQQALSLLPEDDLFLRSLGELNRGIAHWLNNDTQAATWALTRAEALGQAANNTYVILTALCIFTHIQMGQGQLHRAYQTNQRALQLATERKGWSLWATACVYISRGQLFYVWNNLEAAASSLQKGIKLSTRWQHRDLLIYGHTVMAQVKQAQGNSLAAMRLMHLTEQSVQVNQPHPWLVSIMTALQMQLALMQRNFEAIEHWQQTQLCNYVKTFEQMALAQIALARHQYEKALSLLERLSQRAEANGRIGTLIEVRLLQTVAYQQQRAAQKALEAFEQALILAEPEGYIRPFVNGGPSVKALLEEMLAQNGKASRAFSSFVSPDYLRQLLAAYETPPDARTERQPAFQRRQARAEVREALSPREIEIIHLIMAGCSTQEIARRSIIAPTTVRWHIRNIYSKLQIHNRAQVVTRAHELGI